MKTLLIDMLTEWVKTYLKATLDKFVDKSIDRSASLMAAVITVVFMLLLCFFVVVFFTITLALWIGDYLGRVYLGFLIVSGLYLVTGLLFYIFKNSWLKKPLSRQFTHAIKNEFKG